MSFNSESNKIAEKNVKNNEKSSTEKVDILNSTMLSLNKQFGKGSIMRLGEREFAAFPHLSTGVLSLDIALGIGGVPKGRIVEIYGPESSGKTTLSLHIMAQAQKIGGVAALVDAEHALDPVWAEKNGVDVNELLIAQPSYGEEALEIVESLVRSNSLDVIVIDSVAALVPKAEIDGDMGDSHMGLQARLMSQAMRKLTGAIANSNTCVIFINQIRMKIGVMFGSPETTTGGNALKFYSSVRLDTRKIEAIKKGDEQIGIRVRTKVVKNKVAAPFKMAEFELLFDRGFNREDCILTEGVKLNLINKAGTWYSIGDERIGQGKDNACTFLRGNPDMTKKIETQILEAYNIGQHGIIKNIETVTIDTDSSTIVQESSSPKRRSKKDDKDQTVSEDRSNEPIKDN